MTNNNSMLSTAKSGTLLLEEWAAAIDADLSVLLLQHSSIRNLDHDRDRNSGVFFSGSELRLQCPVPRRQAAPVETAGRAQAFRSHGSRAVVAGSRG